LKKSRSSKLLGNTYIEGEETDAKAQEVVKTFFGGSFMGVAL
jgi:hypothetical protein